MRTNWIIAAVCLYGCCLSLNAFPLELDKVKGIELYDGSETARDKLAQNGFVVEQEYYHRIFGPYLDNPLPPFITADSIHRTYHVLFEEALKKFETNAFQEMTVLVEDLHSAMDSTAAPNEEDGPEALAADFIEVALCLLNGSDAPEGRARVVADLAQIRAHGGIAVSAVFGYRMDFSQFKPRGFYTQSLELKRYFQAMSWMGCAAFRLKSEKETAAAMLLANVYRSQQKEREIWNRLDKKYTQLLFQCDDLTIEEYASLLDSMGNGLPARNDFREKANALRDPMYNDMALTPDVQTNWIAESKGMRFMGRRYLPDGCVMKEVTYPEVPARAFPSGLDVLAANGSARAKHHLASAMKADPQYAAGLRKAETHVSEAKEIYAGSHYMHVLNVMNTLQNPPDDRAADFAKTDAYADKNMMTSLAIWASMRHAWVLHAKQNDVSLGLHFEEPIAGYIEPNSVFFDQMIVLLEQTAELFKAADEEIPQKGRKEWAYSSDSAAAPFVRLQMFVEQVQQLLDKQLKGKKYKEKDKQFFADFGKALVALQGNATNSPSDNASPWMALIADVFTEGQSGQCLQVGTGGAMSIYAIVELDGTCHLVRGGVYSYYEFLQPMDNRLTDEEWRAKWEQGNVPASPEWTDSFIAIPQVDVDVVIHALKNGQYPKRNPLFIQDERLDDFLLSAAKGELTGLDPRLQGWLTGLAAQKIPDKVAPLLMDIIRSLPVPDYERNYEFGKMMDENIHFDWDKYRNEMDDFKEKRSRCILASFTMPHLVTPETLPALYEFAQTGANEAAMVMQLLWDVEDKEAETYAVRVLKELEGASAHKNALQFLNIRGSYDVVPDVIVYLDEADDTLRYEALRTLATLLEPVDTEREHWSRYVAEKELQLSEQERSIVQKHLFATLDEALASDSESRMRHIRVDWDALLLLGIRLELPEMEERILEGVRRSLWYPTDALAVLPELPREKATEFLTSLLKAVDYNDCYSIFEMVAYLEYEELIPVMAPYLDDKRYTNLNGLRVCDHARLALEGMLKMEVGEAHLPWDDGPEREEAIRQFDERIRIVKQKISEMNQ